MKNISAGALRHRVTLLRNGNPSTPDSFGRAIPSPTTVGTYYALVECLGGGEVTNASQKKGILNYRVTLRASAGPIRPTDQLTWDGHTLNVESAVTDPFGILIEVTATEKPAQ